MPIFDTPKYVPRENLKLELISQPLYDHLQILSDHDKDYYSFFQNPAGRSRFYTNVATAGALCYPKRFLVQGFKVIMGHSADPDDVAKIYDSARFNFVIGEKDYFNCPLFALDPKRAGPDFTPLSYIYDENRDEAQTEEVICLDSYPLEHPLYIPSIQNFRAAIAMPPLKLKKPVDMWVFLDGTLEREIC